MDQRREERAALTGNLWLGGWIWRCVVNVHAIEIAVDLAPTRTEGRGSAII
jgi:hypothetical protein